MAEAALPILLVEDDPDDVLLTRELLAEMPRLKISLSVARSMAEARAALSTQAFALHLVDVRLGDGYGVDLVAELTRREAGPSIMLTGLADDRSDLQALKAGAADYLVKSTFDAPFLERVLRYTLERHGLMRQLRERESEYRFLFHANPLPMWVYDRRTLRFLEVNEAAVAHYGYGRDEFLALTADRIRPESEREAFMKASEPAMHKVTALGLWRHQRKDGSDIVVEASAQDCVYQDREARLVLVQDVTEREAATMRLRESEHALKALFEQMPVGVWTTDRQGNLTGGNAEARRIWGGEALVGPHEYDVYRGRRLEDGTELTAADWTLARTVATGQPTSDSPLEIEAFDGTRRVILSWALPLPESAGEVGFVEVNLDISELHAAQAERMRGEQRLRQILNDAADGIVVLGEDRNVLFANPAAERLARGRLAAVIEQLLNNNGTDAAEQCVTMHDGSERYIDLRSSDTDWSGQPARLLTLRDVTDRHHTESALRLRQRAIDASLNGIMIVDMDAADCPLVYVNPTFERITGYAAVDVLGRNPRFLQGPESDQPGLAPLRRALAQRREVRTLLRNYRRDGSLFWNDVYLAPVPDERGRVGHYVGIINDVSEYKRYEEEIAYRASHDYLTGLPNRTLLEDRLSQALIFAEREQRSVAVLFIDLDRFKGINDALGHAVGDHVLRLVARRLSAALGAGDTLARIGSDEFVAVLTRPAGGEDAEAIARRLLSLFERPLAVHTHNLYLTCSIGISLFPDNGSNANELIQFADLAMYRAKEHGRNTVAMFANEMQERLMDRLNLGQHLRRALEQGELEVHYQPQVDAHSGDLVAVEALLRWRRGEGEAAIIYPERFLSVAEESGQIVTIGGWVLEEVCRQAVKWGREGLGDFPVAVNISAVQFQRSQFLDEVKAVLERTGLPPERLELELTETLVMDQADRVIALLKALKRLGVRITLDDFGTGYSSLSYLRRFAIDKIKIDRSFVDRIASNSDDAAIARSIIAIAHHLKLKVIAEGVETEAQIGYLRRNHCDEFQGFYFCPPVPADELAKRIRERRLGGERVLQAAPMDTILLVDDEPNIVRALSRTLRRDGYRILTANSPAEGLEVLAREAVDVIVSDQRMPGMSGTEFLSMVRDMYPNTVRIVLSGYTDLTTVTDAINRGAIYKFLTKPWEDEDLRKHIREAFRVTRQDGEG